MRLKLRIEYDGGPFFGWQKHADFPTVQGALEDAVFKLTGERTEVLGAGRTDAGVHACGQVAHVDIDKDLAPGRIRDGLNAHLRPNPIVILDAEAAAPDFHARFSAKKRLYRYRILARRTPPAIDKGRVWWVPRPLDADAMARAAPILIGHHDFTTFRDTNCQAKSPIKTLDSLDVRRDGEIIEIWCEAQSFLHRQVRSMVGSLVEIGVGKWTEDDLKAALEARDRTRCGPVAAAEGLYLMRVTY